MPYAAGVYTLPPGTEATTLTPVDSSDYNAFIADIETAQNAARPVTAGGTGGTSVITGWDGLAKKGTDIATASSINLTTATGPSLSLTGTTTITAVTLAEGSIRVVRAAGAFQITASASLLCNGSSSVNMTVTAEDLLVFRGGAAGVVSVGKIGGGGGAATTSAQGIVELATQTEASLLADTTRAVTPNDLTFLSGLSSTATAAGTTTLTVTSNYFQIFTGTSTQTVVLPDVSTLVVGRSFCIINNSTGKVTVQSSGANTIKVMGGTLITLAPGAPGTKLVVTCISISGTGTASWSYEYVTPTTDWVAYTPTFSNLGTVSSIFAESRRVGDTLEVRAKFTLPGSGGAASEARMSLGFNGADGGVTSDSTKVPAIQVAGIVVTSASVAGTFYATVDSNVGYVNFTEQSGTTNSLAKLNGNGFGAQTMSLKVEIPLTNG